MLFEIGEEVSEPLQVGTNTTDPILARVSCPEEAGCLGRMMTLDVRYQCCPILKKSKDKKKLAVSRHHITTLMAVTGFID